MTETVSTAISGTTPDARTELRTFLIADVRGYTRFTQEHGDEAAARLVTRFAAIMREGVKARSGRVIELRGDEVLAVFTSARQALRASVELQARFARETENDPSLPLAVGIGLDAGEAVPLEDGYRGEVLNLAARLCNLAEPGEILASEGVVYLGRRTQGVLYTMRGVVSLKGSTEPTRVIKVVAESDTAVGAGSTAVPSGAPGESALPIGGFLGALPAGALVGRAPEWERMMATLEQVLQGSGRLLMLSGEPGIGKTRLAQEVTLKARHWGFVVATGRCYEPEQTVPFYPFLEVLAAIYAASPAFIRSEVPRRWPYLLRLLPDAIASLPPGARPTGGQDPRVATSLPGVLGPLEQEDQQRLFRAVTGFVESASDLMPLAILIDDLHWADDSSLKLLQHLARYTRGKRVLLLGTYRNIEVHRQHPLETALLDLSREQLVTEVAVHHLSQVGTAALMAELMGAEEDLVDLVELVYRRTEGNAFFIQEVMRALVERGDLHRKDGRWERRAITEMEVPKSIRSAIGQRLSQLSVRSQEVLREASVLGQEFSFDDLMALAAVAPISPRDGVSWTEDELEGALEEAIGSGLIRERARDRYAFHHALTQQALYAELSTRRRKRLHLAAGKALQGPGGTSSGRGLEGYPERGPEGAPRPNRGGRERRAAELAWHFLEGDDAEQALPYAMLAGDQAEEVFANGDAERQYRTALELAHELGDRSSESIALEKLAGVLTILGRYDQAIELLEHAALLQREANNREGEACAVAQLGHVHFARGTRREGIDRLCPLVEALEGSPPSVGLASLWSAYARLFMDSGQHERELKAAERAVALAQALGDDPAAARLLIGAEVTRSDALWGLGKEEGTLHVLEELIPRAEAAGDLDNLIRALGNAAMYYGQRGDLDRDRAYHERQLEVAERRGDRGNTMMASMALSQNAFLVGDWRLCRVYLERAEMLLEPLHAARAPSIWPIIARAWLTFREGDLERAGKDAGEALILAEGKGAQGNIRLSQRLLAEIALLGNTQPLPLPPDGAQRAPLRAPLPDEATSGDLHATATGALARLEPLLESGHAAKDPGFLRTLAWALLSHGENDVAFERATASVEQARHHRHQPELVESLVIHGMVLAALERWQEAEWDFAEAVSLAQGMPFPFGEGRAHQEWGMMLARQPRLTGSGPMPDQAREQLSEALAIFQRLGARRDAEIVEHQLAGSRQARAPMQPAQAPAPVQPDVPVQSART